MVSFRTTIQGWDGEALFCGGFSPTSNFIYLFYGAALKVNPLSSARFCLLPHTFQYLCNPLGEVIWRSGLSYPQYVDDTQLCRAHQGDPREAVKMVNRCLVAVLG